jgi:hypothetical protein
MIRRIASILACALALTLLASATAQAATRSFRDGRGDVWTMGQNPNTRVPDRDQGDITRVTLQHRQHRIIIRTRFVELDREGQGINIYTRLRTNTGKVRHVYLTAGPQRWAGRTIIEGPHNKAVECTIAHHIDYATNTAVERIPRTCIDNPRTVRAKFGVATAQAGQGFADNPINQRDTDIPTKLPHYTAPIRVG